MLVMKKKTVMLIATAAAVTGLVATSGPAQARPAGPKEKAAVSQPAPASQRPEPAAGLATSAASQKALSTIQSRVRSYVATHGTTYTFGTYTDATTGKIVIDTNAPSKVVASLTSAAISSTATSQSSAAGAKVQVNKQRVSDLFQRRDDTPAFYGGGGLLA